MTLPTRRLRACVESWPEAETGSYDPRCCRFPKSCSATIYNEDRVTDSDLEPTVTTLQAVEQPSPSPYAVGVDRGFAIAVEMLRDDALYEKWWSALPQDHPDYGYWSQHPRRQFADYLTAVGPWEDSMPTPTPKVTR